MVTNTRAAARICQPRILHIVAFPFMSRSLTSIRLTPVSPLDQPCHPSATAVMLMAVRTLAQPCEVFFENSIHTELDVAVSLGGVAEALVSPQQQARVLVVVVE